MAFVVVSLVVSLFFLVVSLLTAFRKWERTGKAE
jgi:hypothetical protein